LGRIPADLLSRAATPSEQRGTCEVRAAGHSPRHPHPLLTNFRPADICCWEAPSCGVDRASGIAGGRSCSLCKPLCCHMGTLGGPRAGVSGEGGGEERQAVGSCVLRACQPPAQARLLAPARGTAKKNPHFVSPHCICIHVSPRINSGGTTTATPRGSPW
jgi:hypothetical protein